MEGLKVAGNERGCLLFFLSLTECRCSDGEGMTKGCCSDAAVMVQWWCSDEAGATMQEPVASSVFLPLRFYRHHLIVA